MNPQVNCPTRHQHQAAHLFLAVAVLTFAVGALAAKVDASTTPNCAEQGLHAELYTTGAAAGIERFAIAITNKDARTCRIGTTLTLLDTRSGQHHRIAADSTSPTFGSPTTAVAARQRVVAQLTTANSRTRKSRNCPPTGPLPTDRVNAVQLQSGAIVTIGNPTDIARCERRIAPLTDDGWLTACEQSSTMECKLAATPVDKR